MWDADLTTSDTIIFILLIWNRIQLSDLPQRNKYVYYWVFVFNNIVKCKSVIFEFYMWAEVYGVMTSFIIRLPVIQ